MTRPFKIDLPKTEPTLSYVPVEFVSGGTQEEGNIFDKNKNGIIEINRSKNIDEISALKPIYEEMGLKISDYMSTKWILQEGNNTIEMGVYMRPDGSSIKYKYIKENNAEDYNKIYRIHYDTKGNELYSESYDNKTDEWKDY